MKCKFLGAKNLDFQPTNKDGQPEGDKVQGIKIILTYPDPDFMGTGVTMPFIKKGSDLYSKLVGNIDNYLNKTVDADYIPGSNGKFKLSDITILDK